MTTIVICITIICVVAIICYTHYQSCYARTLSNYKQDFEKLQEKLRWVDNAFHHIEDVTGDIFGELNNINRKLK